MQRNKESEEDQILKELQYIKHRINTSSSILTDKEKTAFFFVLIPEEMIILDTKKAAGLFAKFDVPLAGYIVNRVIPAELADQDIPDYLRNRLEMQNEIPGGDRPGLWRRGVGAVCLSSSAISPGCP